MQVELITNKSEWQKFLEQQTPQLFVQAWEYAEFNKATGDEAFFVGIRNQAGEIVAGSIVITVNARRGRFYYLPYGPIITEANRAQEFQAIHTFLCQKAKSDQVAFIRISPFWTDNNKNRQIFTDLGYRNAPMHILAETTWILPLNKTPEELLRNMKQNHRNLIRRAEREGVVIKKSHSQESLEALHNLLQTTASRHNFTPFSLKYITSEFNAFAPDHATIYEAHYQGEILGSAIIMQYGDTAVYRHSASTSDPKFRKVPANYAIQWQAIKDAQEKGCKYYNFWGIAPEGASKNHPFAGLNHFKKGFDGEQIDLIHCQDYPISWRYWLNYLVETFRRIKRGF